MEQQDIDIINKETKKEKIKNFFLNNRKLLISVIVILILILLSFFSFKMYRDGHRESLANKYNSTVIEFKNVDNSIVITSMKEIIEDKDSTYSPLAFYFLLDNNLIKSKEDINKYFDLLIRETKLEKEIKNLIIYKKALFNSETASESELLKILNPLINKDSVWKSHALYLLGEYFLSKNEKQKSREFFEKILTTENSDSKIKFEAQKRLQRDLSE